MSVSREDWSAGPVHLASDPVSNQERRLEVAMAWEPLASLLVYRIAVGLPPHQPGQSDPLSWTESLFVVVGVVISFYFSVRLVTWLMIKISSFELFLELRRELEPRHKPPLDRP